MPARRGLRVAQCVRAKTHSHLALICTLAAPSRARVRRDPGHPDHVRAADAAGDAALHECVCRGPLRWTLPHGRFALLYCPNRPMPPHRLPSPVMVKQDVVQAAKDTAEVMGTDVDQAPSEPRKARAQRGRRCCAARQPESPPPGAPHDAPVPAHLVEAADRLRDVVVSAGACRTVPVGRRLLPCPPFSHSLPLPSSE